MSKYQPPSSLPDSSRSSWIPRNDSPAPNAYYPQQPDTTTGISLKGKQKSIFDIPAGSPGPADYSPYSNWLPNRNALAMVHKSGQRNEMGEDAMNGDQSNRPLNINTISGASFGDYTSHSPEDYFPNLRTAESLDESRHVEMDNIDLAKSDPSFRNKVLGIDSETPFTNGLSDVGFPEWPDSSYVETSQFNQPTSQEEVVPVSPGPLMLSTNDPPPIASINWRDVPKDPSPLTWLSDGKLAVIGFLLSCVTFILGILQIVFWAWTLKGQCIFTGVWLMLFGLIFLITEGMLIPKITIFNRITILYVPTRLINQQPYWFKTILYAIVPIIGIAVCATWASGLGGGCLIVLAILYGCKEVDYRMKQRREGQERTSRRPEQHVPITVISLGT